MGRAPKSKTAKLKNSCSVIKKVTNYLKESFDIPERTTKRIMGDTIGRKRLTKLICIISE